jgi:hypothetical protein
MTPSTDIPPHLQAMIAQLDAQIADAKRMIEAQQQVIRNLEFGKEYLLKERPQLIRLYKKNSPLTRDLIRNFIAGYGQPIQTTKIISLLYDTTDEAEVKKLVRTLSVILSQMEKNNEITKEKRDGVKGNFYKWNPAKPS